MSDIASRHDIEYRQAENERLLTIHEEELTHLRKQVALLVAEVRGWHEHAHDSHDTNYGHCRPGCTKCESKRRAWILSEATNADPELRAMIEGKP